MRKEILGLTALAMLLAPPAVRAKEQAEQPVIDPAGLPQAAPAVSPPQSYPAAQQDAPAASYPAAQTPYPPAQSSYTPAESSYPPAEQPYAAAQSQPQAYPASDGAGGAGFVPQQQESFQPAWQPPAQEYQPPQSYGSPFYQNRQSSNYGFGAPANYTGYSPAPSYQQYPQWGPQGAMLHPRVATAQAGLTINVDLQTAISTQVAKDGDFVQAKIAQNVPLSGLSYIPAGSVITGQVTEAQAGRMLNRSGSLSVTFNKLQMPDGQSVPIQAHVLGDIGKYQQKNGEYHGEGWGAKLAGFAERAAIGAGGGALFGTALGGITGRVGTGAWAGTAIGGGLGVADDLFLRRGRNVLIQAGTPMQIQLDAPVEVPVELPQQSAYGAG